MCKRLWPALLLMMGFAPFAARGACVELVPDFSAQTPVTAWNDVLHTSAGTRDNPNIAHSQYLDEDGTGSLFLDYFAVRLEARGETPQALLTRFRAELPNYLAAHGKYAMQPFDADSQTKWSSAASPFGALLVFKLPGYPRLAGQFADKHGAMVVTCATPLTFTLSYVGVTAPFDGPLDGLQVGRHPLTGNRSFGVVDNQDGTFTLFMKAAMRKNRLVPESRGLPVEGVVQLETQLWQALFTQFRAQMAARQPRVLVSEQRRAPFEPKLSAR